MLCHLVAPSPSQALRQLRLLRRHVLYEPRYTLFAEASQHTPIYYTTAALPLVSAIRWHSVCTDGPPGELVSSQPAAMMKPIAAGCCRGCGATLQSDLPEKLGYLPPLRVHVAPQLEKWNMFTSSAPLPGTIPVDDGSYLALNPQHNHYVPPATLERDRLRPPVCMRCYSLKHHNLLPHYETNAVSDVIIPSKGKTIVLLQALWSQCTLHLTHIITQKPTVSL